MWMYCSAIFYPVQQLSGPIRVVIEHNPLYIYIHGMRSAVLYGALPEPGDLAQMLLWSLGMCLTGYTVFRRSRNKIMERI